MEKRTKILYGANPIELEAGLNSFLSQTEGKLTDIKFACDAVWDPDLKSAATVLMALILYIPTPHDPQ